MLLVNACHQHGLPRRLSTKRMKMIFSFLTNAGHGQVRYLVVCPWHLLVVHSGLNSMLAYIYDELLAGMFSAQGHATLSGSCLCLVQPVITEVDVKHQTAHVIGIGLTCLAARK